VTVLEEAASICGEVTEPRHAIHREPEIGYDLPGTQEKVLAALDGFPLEITLGRQLASVTAVLRGGRPGPVVLLRGDMDALPVTEAGDDATWPVVSLSTDDRYLIVALAHRLGLGAEPRLPGHCRRCPQWSWRVVSSIASSFASSSTALRTLGHAVEEGSAIEKWVPSTSISCASCPRAVAVRV
jgi:hypothetical protein